MTAISLRQDSIAAYWGRLGKPAENIVNSMELCEDWVVDGHQPSEQLIEQLSELLSGATPEDIAAATGMAPVVLTSMMGLMHSGRALMMLTWLFSVHPEIAPTILATRDASDSKDRDTLVRLMLERMQTLERSRILSRVFSPERLSVILEILEASSTNNAH